jgi:glycosyltransferase involved in cell wall biosynthesis
MPDSAHATDPAAPTSAGTHEAARQSAITAGETAARPLRVMHVFGGRVRSGVEAVVLDFVDCLLRAGGEAVLVPLAEGPFVQQARDLGFTVHSLAKKRRYDVIRIPKLARLIKQHSIDIVHSHAVNGAFYGCPAGRMAHVPGQVSTFHAGTKETLADVYRWELPRTLAHRYHIWVTRCCQRLTTVTPMLREELIRTGIPAEKIVYVPNSIDLDIFQRARPQRDALRAEFGLAPQTTVVGSIARLSKAKNLPLLLNAAKRLIDARLDVSFVVVGDGPERDSLERTARGLGIASRVHFAGWRDDIPEMLAAFDIFGLSSLTEGLPKAALEAMASGIPIVATDVGGMSQLVRHGETGLLVPAGDLDQLTEAIRSLIRNPDQAQRMGQAGHVLVSRQFSPTVMCRRIMEVYTDVLPRQP